MRMQFMADKRKVMAKSPAFSGVPRAEIAALLDDVGAYERCYARDEVVRHIGDRLDAFPIVIEGAVRGHVVQGERRMIVQQFGPGEPFAEAIAMSAGTCPVEIVAVEPTRVLYLPAQALCLSKRDDARVVQMNLMREMSKKVDSLRVKLELMAEPRLAERVMAYLGSLPQRPDGTVTLPFKYCELAEYLGVNKTSLSRTLHVLEEDGRIEVGARRTLRVLDGRAAARCAPGGKDVTRKGR